MHQDRIRDAQRCAKALLHRFGVRAATHIVIEAFAARLDVEIIEAPLDGATAQLVRNGKRTMIFVSDRVVDPAARTQIQSARAKLDGLERALDESEALREPAPAKNTARAGWLTRFARWLTWGTAPAAPEVRARTPRKRSTRSRRKSR